MSAYGPSLFGGMLLGLACILLFLFNGRIAGISGIMGRMFGRERRLADLAFIAIGFSGPFTDLGPKSK